VETDLEAIPGLVDNGLSHVPYGCYSHTCFVIFIDPFRNVLISPYFTSGLARELKNQQTQGTEDFRKTKTHIFL
jgi:hypothetical protein